MIVGLGMDLVEIGRLARILDGPPGRAERFLQRIFTPAERATCEPRRDRATAYAARWAAKEAAYKALGGAPGARWTDFEVVRAEGGAPRLVLAGAAAEAARAIGATRQHLTLTHDGGMAAATVILEAP
ncbi:MAG: holo-ACP synthase [Anaeromyxobacter sp.]|nr:holo-ACP synthase [Anaeromyxobacter sp.]